MSEPKLDVEQKYGIAIAKLEDSYQKVIDNQIPGIVLKPEDIRILLDNTLLVEMEQTYPKNKPIFIDLDKPSA